jgi:hypothetical protein
MKLGKFNELTERGVDASIESAKRGMTKEMQQTAMEGTAGIRRSMPNVADAVDVEKVRRTIVNKLREDVSKGLRPKVAEEIKGNLTDVINEAKRAATEYEGELTPVEYVIAYINETEPSLRKYLTNFTKSEIPIMELGSAPKVNPPIPSTSSPLIDCNINVPTVSVASPSITVSLQLT